MLRVPQMSGTIGIWCWKAALGNIGCRFGFQPTYPPSAVPLYMLRPIAASGRLNLRRKKFSGGNCPYRRDHSTYGIILIMGIRQIILVRTKPGLCPALPEVPESIRHPIAAPQLPPRCVSRLGTPLDSTQRVRPPSRNTSHSGFQKTHLPKSP